jgi:hypothetical protein
MNDLNYATLEASKRLVEAGIVLETDCCWMYHSVKKRWKLAFRSGLYNIGSQIIPAPSMAEVWRELPETTSLRKEFGSNFSIIFNGDEFEGIGENTNPTDALIDLLIWVKGQKT